MIYNQTLHESPGVGVGGGLDRPAYITQTSNVRLEYSSGRAWKPDPTKQSSMQHQIRGVPGDHALQIHFKFNLSVPSVERQ